MTKRVRKVGSVQRKKRDEEKWRTGDRRGAGIGWRGSGAARLRKARDIGAPLDDENGKDHDIG